MLRDTAAEALRVEKDHDEICVGDLFGLFVKHLTHGRGTSPS